MAQDQIKTITKVKEIEDQLEEILSGMAEDIEAIITEYGEEYRDHIKQYIGASL